MNPSRLNDYLSSLTQKYEIPVYGCSVHYDRTEVLRCGNDTSGSDFFRFYSITKPVTGFAAMQLIEQDRLGLYDEVSRYLPAFHDLYCLENGQRILCDTPLRIWHLLTMSGGFDYNDEFDEMRTLLSNRRTVSTAGAVSLLAKRTLSFRPGTHYQYSLGMDILGAVIEIVSGVSLPVYMKENIFDPLGCTDLTFYPDTMQYARMSPQVTANTGVSIGKENCFLHAKHFPSGGCGLCGTVDDFMLFLDMLVNNGITKEGCRLIGEETLNLFATPLLCAAAQTELESLKAEPEHQALGVRIRPYPPGEGLLTADGAAGAYAIADRKKRLSLFFCAHVLDYHPVFEEIHSKILHLLYES